MVEYCDKSNYTLPTQKPEKFSCEYNNTIFFTNEFESDILAMSCTTFVTSTLILLFAIYVTKNAFSLPNRSFFILILGFILAGTVSGTYAVFVQYRIYVDLAGMPVLSDKQFRCIFAELKNISLLCPSPSEK